MEKRRILIKHEFWDWGQNVGRWARGDKAKEGIKQFVVQLEFCLIKKVHYINSFNDAADILNHRLVNNFSSKFCWKYEEKSTRKEKTTSRKKKERCLSLVNLENLIRKNQTKSNRTFKKNFLSRVFVKLHQFLI